MNDLDTINRLTQDIETHRDKARELDAYYNGKHRLEALGLSLPPGFDRLQTVVNWPRLVVDALDERLDVEGFRMGGTDTADDRLWQWWQVNRLDVESSLAHTEALVQGVSYICVGLREDDLETPLFTVESRHNMTVDNDPRTKVGRSALRLYDYREEDPRPHACTLYLPDRTSFFELRDGQWFESERDEHNLGRLPVVPLVNRSRIADRCGRSEMADIIPLTDAACRSLTNLQGAQELLALPQRYVLGATAEDFVGSDGNQKTQWEAYMGRFLALANEDAKIGQVPAADLRNFGDTVNLYARLISGQTGLPADHLGLTSDNPASADAIRSQESRHVKRAERRARRFGEGWEESMLVGLLLIDGEAPPSALRMETVWRDPATPTFSAKADAVVKLYSARGPDGPLLPREAAWEELGYSPTKRKRLLALSSDDPAVRYLAATDGLPELAPAANDA